MSFLAIDVGTTNIKALVLSEEGRFILFRTVPTPLVRKDDGGIELDARAIYATVTLIIAGIDSELTKDRIENISFSSLGTVMVPIGKNGEPVGFGISSLDTRATPWISEYSSMGIDPDWLYATTGQSPSSLAFFHNLAFMRQQNPALMKQCKGFLSIRGFAVSRLCGIAVEDYSWASRTMLFDTSRNTWSPEILNALRLDPRYLPPLNESTFTMKMLPSVSKRLGLRPHVSVTLGGLDNCCAYAGASGGRNDSMVNLIGTYEHLISIEARPVVDEFVKSSGSFLFRYLFPGYWASCSRFTTGYAMQELLRQMKLSERQDELYRKISDTPSGAFVIPSADTSAAVRDAFQGPYKPELIAQSMLEGFTYLEKRYLTSFECNRHKVEQIIVAGGATCSRQLLRMRANILNKPLLIPKQAECSCIGAVQLAFIGSGKYTAQDSMRVTNNPIVESIEPDEKRNLRYEEAYREFLAKVEEP